MRPILLTSNNTKILPKDEEGEERRNYKSYYFLSTKTVDFKDEYDLSLYETSLFTATSNAEVK
jgi:hypothetical protein